MGSSVAPEYRRALLAYLISFGVPVGCFVEALLAICKGTGHRLEVVVLVGSFLWTAAGVLALAHVSDRSRFLTAVARPLIALYSVYLALAVLQGFSSLFLVRYGRRTIYEPGTQHVLINDPKVLPGSLRRAKFTINEVGLRGPNLRGAEDSYKIITVGSSTTICYALDDCQEWPHLLMQALNERQKKVPVWVANAGALGFTCVDDLGLLRKCPILSQANMFTFLIGGTDMETSLAAAGDPTQSMLEADVTGNEPLALPTGSMFRHFFIFRLISYLSYWRESRQAKEHAKQGSPILSDEEKRERYMRQTAPIVALPSLAIGLQEFQSRIVALTDECNSRRIRCVFLTQPYLDRPDLSPAEQKLLKSGRVGQYAQPRGYVSVADLARAMSAYNQKLLQVCRDRDLECYDLASHIPKDTTMFWDDFHFSVTGAQKTADYLAQQLLNTRPFDLR